MLEGNPIEKQLNTILKEKFRRHICSILYDHGKSVGTGNLIKHNDQLFILTCRHIAIDAYASKSFEIIFPTNKVVHGNQIALFRKYKYDDIALLRIEEPNPQVEDLVPLTLSEFTTSADLRIFSQSNSQIVLGGFPVDLARQDISKGTTPILKALLFQTMPPIGKRQTKARIYLEYQPENTNTRYLPDAPGLSGAGIWYVPVNNQILSPTHWKIIAIQSAWKRGEYIVGTTVRKIFEWLT